MLSSAYRECKVVERKKANAFNTFEAQPSDTEKKLSAHYKTENPTNISVKLNFLVKIYTM